MTFINPIIGEDELNNNTALIKHMSSGTQEEVALDKLLETIKSRIAKEDM